LTAPKVGAAISRDGGITVQDLGIVLESGDAVDCAAKNGFFAGGHGDASVILDRENKYFYLFFTNYGGPVWEQGVAVVRIAFEDRHQPVGIALILCSREFPAETSRVAPAPAPLPSAGDK
jgi:hypothetical protein